MYSHMSCNEVFYDMKEILKNMSKKDTPLSEDLKMLSDLMGILWEHHGWRIDMAEDEA